MSIIDSTKEFMRFNFYKDECFLKSYSNYSSSFTFSDNIEDDFLNFVSDQKKVILKATPSFYHFFIDLLGNIVNFFNYDKDILFLIDINGFFVDYDGRKEFLEFFLKTNKINYKFINGSFQNIKVNNFYNPLHIYGIPEPVPFDANKIYEYLLKYFNIINHAPIDKVYISRKNMEQKKLFINKNDLLNKNKSKIIYNEISTKRIDDEEKIENFFKNHGFKIVYGENFNHNLSEQINIFYKAKLLVGLTGGGLTNSLFMQPGSSVLELSTSLFFNDESGEGLIEDEHHFYKILSRSKNHFYYAIDNSLMNADAIIKKINNNKVLMELIHG